MQAGKVEGLASKMVLPSPLPGPVKRGGVGPAQGSSLATLLGAQGRWRFAAFQIAPRPNSRNTLKAAWALASPEVLSKCPWPLPPPQAARSPTTFQVGPSSKSHLQKAPHLGMETDL